jgi:(1->4)-alpha-D-glucan 1-alpha-D-glucosylmutase
MTRPAPKQPAPKQPGPKQPVPSATYRIQLTSDFGFDQVTETLPDLARLGVSHVYLSPVLQAAPGSTHGYDVVDHTRISDDLGGAAGLERLVAALAEHGLSAIADVVPNHMSMPTPLRLNRALWSVLRDGPSSPQARWFDVDWTVPDRAVLLPVLGDRIGTVLATGQLTLDRSGDEPVLRYHEHEFPVRPGTEDLPLLELVDRQWYRLAWWRVADEELNYRRFFDVDTLAAVRVELPEVFEATHAVLLDLVRRGALTGLRIDHPDGLADPRGYLRRLAGASGSVWVVVEKILEADEELPPDWRCAGTTGYDALARVGGLFVDPAGAAPLARLQAELTGSWADLSEVVAQAKREVVEQGLYAEVHRLVDLMSDICRDDIMLRDHTRRSLHDAVIELLVAFDRYRAYVVPGEPAPAVSVQVVEAAVERARAGLGPEGQEALELVRDLVLGRPLGGPTPIHAGARSSRRDELMVRFQQTCGPVMAKGVEDTAFYRWQLLVGLNEVGGDPGRFGVTGEEFHGYCQHRQALWPDTMTTLSTHDTKRSEDVRARLAVLAELPAEWSVAVHRWRLDAAVHRGQAWPDPSTEYLFWQTLVGLWTFGAEAGPPAPDRVTGYLVKAVREAKQQTSWTAPDEGYEAAVLGFAEAVLADQDLIAAVGEFCDLIAGPARVGVLGQKLVQLTMPGVPDVYQGCELVDLSLVDPDNRRPVDYAARSARLARLDDGSPAADLDDEKLLVTSRALRLRRDRPDWFTGPDAAYQPLPTSTGNEVAFGRGAPEQPGCLTVVTRMPVALARLGGWGEHTVVLPDGRWRDELTGSQRDGGATRLADLLADLPVALLRRQQ